MAKLLPLEREQAFWDGVENARRFFMGEADVQLAPEGLRRLKAAVLGRGYVEKFPGSRGLRDTEAGVDIDVVLAGEYPGDGKPKPVAFPDPADAAVRGQRVALLPLAQLIELWAAAQTRDRE